MKTVIACLLLVGINIIISGCFSNTPNGPVYSDIYSITLESDHGMEIPWKLSIRNDSINYQSHDRLTDTSAWFKIDTTIANDTLLPQLKASFNLNEYLGLEDSVNPDDVARDFATLSLEVKTRDNSSQQVLNTFETKTVRWTHPTPQCISNLVSRMYSTRGWYVH